MLLLLLLKLLVVIQFWKLKAIEKVSENRNKISPAHMLLKDESGEKKRDLLRTPDYQGHRGEWPIKTKKSMKYKLVCLCLRVAWRLNRKRVYILPLCLKAAPYKYWKGIAGSERNRNKNIHRSLCSSESGQETGFQGQEVNWTQLMQCIWGEKMVFFSLFP